MPEPDHVAGTVARDARLVTAALDAIVDLELIGDYAYEMVGLGSAKQGRLPSQILVQISEIGAKIKEILSIAIDSWRNEDRGLALTARPRVAAIRAECHALADKVALLTSAPGDVTAYVNMLLICRRLERIMRPRRVRGGTSRRGRATGPGGTLAACRRPAPITVGCNWLPESQ